MFERAKRLGFPALLGVLTCLAGPAVSQQKPPAPLPVPPKQPTTKPAPKKPPPKKLTPLQQEDKDWRASPLVKIRFRGVWLGTFPEQRHYRGDVVLLEFSDYFTAPCRKSTATMTEIHRRYHRSGLTILGVLMPSTVKDKNKGRTHAAAKKTIPYTVTSKADGKPVEDVKTVPYVMIFDHVGAELYRGPLSSKILAILKDALAKRPHPMLGPMEYTELADAAKLVTSGKWGAAHALATEKVKGPAAAEAREIMARLNRDADARYKDAEDYTHSPTERVKMLQEMARLYAGSIQGDKAGNRLKEWQTDDTLKKELLAEREFLSIASTAKLIPVPPADPAKQRQWMAKYGVSVRSLIGRADRMRKKYAFTWGLRQMEDLVAKLSQPR
jgi:hypothetical protein